MAKLSKICIEHSDEKRSAQRCLMTNTLAAKNIDQSLHSANDKLAVKTKQALRNVV